MTQRDHADRRVLVALALAAAAAGLMVAAGLGTPRAAAAGGILWGIDTVDNTQAKNDVTQTQATLGNPQFVGRYLIWGGGSIGADEVRNLHAQNLPILLIDSPPGSSLVGGALGATDAQAAINQATTLGVPTGKALFRDVEASYAIDAAYIAGFYGAFHGSGYVPGFYENAITGAFDGAYCGAVSGNAGIGSGVVLYANEPEFSAGDPHQSAMPAWGPIAPPCQQTTVAWQYEERGLFPPAFNAPNVDVDQFQPQYLNLLWGPSGSYQALPPQRILDTRVGLRTGTCSNGCLSLGPNSSFDLQVEGSGGVPSVGVSAVMMNVTVTNPSAGSNAAPNFVTVYPTGPQSRPLASNLNFVAGQTVPNLVEVPLGTGGQVTIYNHDGSTDLIADVEGYVLSSVMTGGNGLYTAVSPLRVGDTRAGSGQPDQGQTVGPNSIHAVQVGGMGAVPTTGVSAVVLNVTVTHPTAGSSAAPNFATVFPGGTNTPLASDLNFVAGQTVPNRVIVPVGRGSLANGQVWIYNRDGYSDYLVDVGGWFTDASNAGASGSVLMGVVPNRLCDSRPNTGTPCSGPALTAAGVLNVMVAGRGGVPAMGGATAPKAVALNVTVTNPSMGTVAGPNFLTVFPGPAGGVLPPVSDLNFVAGETVPNLVIVKVGSDGTVNLKVFEGVTDVLVDVVGWYG